MKKFEVIFYETLDGECPIEEFLNSFDKKMRAKIIGMLEILEERGNTLREPYSKFLGDGILNFDVNLEVILQEFYTFSFMKEK